MITQILIAFTGVVAIWLATEEGPSRRYAPLFGLAGQPLWFYSAYTAEQWGILFLTLVYTLSWAKGFRTHWLKK